MSSSPETGRRFGPYEIHSRLGGGGMGAVFRAWDARLHREVAIKLLHDEYAMPGMRERFLREARAASALNHPNICTIFDIGEQDGDPYLVMELLEGETLRDRITERSLPVEDMICIAKEAAEALGAAHAKGVIHRDVKPANIFIVQRPNGTIQAKVLDFGLAKIEGGVLGARHSRSMDLTSAGSTVGTLAYMSPEQARGEPLDSRSDLFSLGVVLYEMATRHVPFPGATSALVFVKLLNQAPEPVRDWNESVPRDLEKIILKLMAKERTARFQTAQELIEALRQVNEKGGGSWLRKAAAVVPLVRVPEPGARRKRLGSQLRRNETPQPEPGAALPAPDSATPRLSSSEAPHFLRPVARMPRSDASPRPGASGTAPVGGTGQASSADAISLPVAPTPAAVAAAAVSPSTENRERAAQPAAESPSHPGLQEAELTPSGSFPEAFAEESAVRPERSGRRLQPRTMYLAGVGVLLCLLALAVYWYVDGHFGPALVLKTDPIVVTSIENRTGDKSLDGTVAAALGLDLKQSPYFLLRGPEAFNLVQHQRALEGEELDGPVAARDLAKRLKAAAYLYGSVQGHTAHYVLHVDLVNTGTGDVMTTAEEHAASLAEIPAAVDRLATTLRTAMGEPSDSIAHDGNALSRDATANLDALHALAQGDAAQAAGHALDALRFYQQAARLDSHFVQVQLRLVDQYRHLRADEAAANAARLALSASDKASERMRVLSQAEYEMAVSGDFAQATGILRRALSASPHEARFLILLARSLRLQGHLTEALQSSQQALEQDPYALEAYDEAESALIGLDRYDAAFQLHGQVDRLGVQRPGESLAAAYLGNRADAVSAARSALDAGPAGYRADWAYGLYLDNTGRLAAGQAVWRDRAGLAAEIPELDSAAAALLSQGALDDALAGNCESGLALARQAEGHSASLNATYNLGMAYALCGAAEPSRQAMEALQKLYPQSFAVTGFYIADLKAALALEAGDPAAALEILKPARQYDMISLTPYLRGRAHVALRQVQIGIVDYQTVLAHRGITFQIGGTVYPVAEIGVARAFADTGDIGNSAAAYRRFLDLWQNADPGQPLVTEARARAR